MDSDTARGIMLAFAERTGLIDDGRPPVRYLWTDAFAVCNFLGDYGEHGREESLRLALRLVDQTHRVLGRHRPDDPRSGWISGLSEAEGEAHPTRGGLRIGKRFPERRPGEPYDPEKEWDRDGQYFHYLTRWMHALDRVGSVTGDATYHRWARELARAACAGFLHRTPDGTPHLVWKMSVGLDRPQVASTGQHDPLDGWITCRELEASRTDDAGPGLEREIQALAALCRGRRWDTDDALGIGGLLCDAHRLAQLERRGAPVDPPLREALLQSSLRGLEILVAHRAFDGTATRRLGFRELGLAIGLHAVERMAASEGDASAADTALRGLAPYGPLAERIERFWLDPAHRASPTWTDHRDINDVMLATSLAPSGYLTVGPG